MLDSSAVPLTSRMKATDGPGMYRNAASLSCALHLDNATSLSKRLFSSASVCPRGCLCISLSPIQSVFFFVLLFVIESVPVCVCITHSLSLTMSVFLCLSVCLRLFFSFSLSVSVCLCLCVPLLSVYVCLSLYLSVCLSLCMPLSI